MFIPEVLVARGDALEFRGCHGGDVGEGVVGEGERGVRDGRDGVDVVSGRQVRVETQRCVEGRVRKRVVQICNTTKKK